MEDAGHARERGELVGGDLTLRAGELREQGGLPHLAAPSSAAVELQDLVIAKDELLNRFVELFGEEEDIAGVVVIELLVTVELLVIELLV